MPESFDSMLEELAEAAASAIVPPGLDAVRRRARERVVHRRMAVSALVLTLIGGSGGAWAAVSQHPRTNDTVGPMGAGTTSAAARPSQTSGASGVAASPSLSAVPLFSSGTELSIWTNGPKQDGYLMVFADGVVALSSAGSFPLCYGRLVTTGSPWTVVVSGVPTTKLALSDVACDDYGTTSGLSIDPVKAGSVLQLVVPANGASTAYAQLYTRTQDVSDGVTNTPMTRIPTGTWKSSDINNRTLVIGADGSVTFTAHVPQGKQYTGVGTIDAEFPTGARAVIECASSLFKGAACGVLLIEQNPQTADEIVVYGSGGPETFIRAS